MTVKLLAAWNGNSPGIITLDGTTEARLIAQGLATADVDYQAAEDGEFLRGVRNRLTGGIEIFGPDGKRVPGAITADQSVILFGDSITNYNTTGPISNATATWSRGYMTWANAFLGERGLTVVANAGVGGDTTTQMLARIDADVLAVDAGFVFVMGGINDIAGNLSTADVVIANLAEIYSRLRAAGYVVIAGTVTPVQPAHTNYGPTVTGRLATVNAWIKAEAAAGRVVLADVAAALVDSAGVPIAEYYADATHPGPAGARMMGLAVADAVVPYVQHGRRRRQSNLLANGVMLNPSSGLAAGWTKGDTGSTSVATVDAAPDGIGNRQCLEVAFAASGNSSYLRGEDVFAKVQSGDVVQAECEVEVLTDGINVQGIQLHLSMIAGSTIIPIAMYRDVASVFECKAGDKLLLRTLPYTLGVDATRCRPEVFVYGAGAGSVKIAVSKARIWKS